MMMKLLNKTTSSVSGAALILGASILASRIFGLVRDRILAGMFDASLQLDIYFAAFRIPDLIYSLIMGGAISTAFIPVFISKRSQNKEKAWEVARSFFYVALITLLIVSIIGFIAMPQLMKLVAPGFDAEALSTAVTMARIMLLSPLFLGLSAVFTGILQSFRKFFVYSLAPIFYNIGIIIGALFFTDFIGLTGLGWGVALGAFMHMLIQAPASFSSGFRLEKPKQIFTPAIRRIVRLMIPRAFGLGAFQINMWVMTAIASTLAAGSLSIFNLANHIQYIPIGLVGISFATAVFPNLSDLYAENKYKNYLNEFSRIFRGVLFLVLPLSVLFFVLRAQIVRVVLGTGNFGWEATQLTAAALGAFSIGIFAYALAPVVSRAFYAQENTKTPVIATSAGMGLNIILSWLLIFVIFPSDGLLKLLGTFLKIQALDDIAVIGLPISVSISGIMALIFLLWAFFRDKRNKRILGELGKSFLRIAGAGIFAGVIAWFTLQGSSVLLFNELDRFWQVFTQGAIASIVAFAAYLLIAYIFRFDEFEVITSFIRSKPSKENIPSTAEVHKLNGFSDRDL